MAFYTGKNKKTDPAQTDLFEQQVFGLREEIQQFIDHWNGKIWLPKIQTTPRQARMIRNAFDRPFFRAHWKETFSILARSVWLRTKMRPAFSLDWYLQSDNFDKILEGKYITEPETNPMSNHKIIRDGDDEDIL